MAGIGILQATFVNNLAVTDPQLGVLVWMTFDVLETSTLPSNLIVAEMNNAGRN